MIRLLLKLLVLCQLTAFLCVSSVYAQFSSSDSSTASALEEGEEGEEVEDEEDEEEEEFVKGIRMEIFIKNVSAFKKTLTAYDNVCRRYVFSVKRFRAYQKERAKVCIDENGFADITISRLTGARKKRYKEVEERDIVKFP